MLDFYGKISVKNVIYNQAVTPTAMQSATPEASKCLYDEKNFHFVCMYVYTFKMHKCVYANTFNELTNNIESKYILYAR